MIWLTLSAPRTLTKLDRFKDLEAGWKFGRGGPISEPVIARAKAIYSALMALGLHRTDAFAGADGEVLVTAYYLKNYVSIEIDPSGMYSLVHEHDKKECCDFETLNLEQLKEHLRAVAREIWGTYDSSTLTISTGIPANSTILPSRIHPAEVCRYFSKTAPLPEVA